MCSPLQCVTISTISHPCKLAYWKHVSFLNNIGTKILFFNQKTDQTNKTPTWHTLWYQIHFIPLALQAHRAISHATSPSLISVWQQVILEDCTNSSNGRWMAINACWVIIYVRLTEMQTRTMASDCVKFLAPSSVILQKANPSCLYTISEGKRENSTTIGMPIHTYNLNVHWGTSDFKSKVNLLWNSVQKHLSLIKFLSPENYPRHPISIVSHMFLFTYALYSSQI